MSFKRFYSFGCGRFRCWRALERQVSLRLRGREPLAVDGRGFVLCWWLLLGVGRRARLTLRRFRRFFFGGVAFA